MPTFQNRGSYLYVEITEPYSLNVILSAIQRATDICESENLSKALFDLRAINENISAMDRYDMGIQVAKFFGPRIKVASVAQASFINYLAENVAVNRGGNLRAFSDIEKAMEWLEVEGDY